MDANVWLTGAGSHVPVDPANVVTGNVGPDLRQLGTNAQHARAVVAGEHAPHAASDADVERPQQLLGDRSRPRLGRRRGRRVEDGCHAALGRARSVWGTGTVPSTRSRISSGCTSSASAWYVRTSRCRS